MTEVFILLAAGVLHLREWHGQAQIVRPVRRDPDYTQHFRGYLKTPEVSKAFWVSKVGGLNVNALTGTVDSTFVGARKLVSRDSRQSRYDQRIRIPHCITPFAAMLILLSDRTGGM